VQTAHSGAWLVNIGMSICQLLGGDIPFMARQSNGMTACFA
jgi:hypothetical protein